MCPEAQHLLHRQVDRGQVPRLHLHAAGPGGPPNSRACPRVPRAPHRQGSVPLTSPAPPPRLPPSPAGGGARRRGPAHARPRPLGRDRRAARRLIGPRREGRACGSGRCSGWGRCPGAAGALAPLSVQWGCPAAARGDVARARDRAKKRRGRREGSGSQCSCPLL